MSRRKVVSNIEDPFNQMIGANLRYCRLLRKLSMSDVANNIGVAHQQIYKYENGINALTVFRLKQFAEFFKEDIKNLINPNYIAIMCKIVQAGVFETKDGEQKIGSVDLSSLENLTPEKAQQVKVINKPTLHINYKDHGEFVEEFKPGLAAEFNAANYEQFREDYPDCLSKLEDVDPKMRATYDALRAIRGKKEVA